MDVSEIQSELNQVFKIPNQAADKLGSFPTCLELKQAAAKLASFTVLIIKISLGLKSSSWERNHLTESMRKNKKNSGSCCSCSYLRLLTSSADYPGNIMLTHFTVPAPNSVLLQVSKSSDSHDSQSGGGGNETSGENFQNKSGEPRVENEWL